jgi:hypothetical protein
MGKRIAKMFDVPEAGAWKNSVIPKIRAKRRKAQTLVCLTFTFFSRVTRRE